MAFVTESAATNRSFLRFRALVAELGICWNACLTSPPSPERESIGVLGVLPLPPPGSMPVVGDWPLRERGLLFGVDLGEPWFWKQKHNISIPNRRLWTKHARQQTISDNKESVLHCSSVAENYSSWRLNCEECESVAGNCSCWKLLTVRIVKMWLEIAAAERY